MTYLLVHLEDDVLRFKFNDGGQASDCWTIEIDQLEEFCEDKAYEALNDGNYYSGTGSGVWNKKKREYVSSRWKNLVEVVKNQYSTGEVNIEILNYFSPVGEKGVEAIVTELEKVIKNIKANKYSVSKLVDLMDVLEEANL